jgi:hypothetical protein
MKPAYIQLKLVSMNCADDLQSRTEGKMCKGKQMELHGTYPTVVHRNQVNNIAPNLWLKESALFGWFKCKSYKGQGQKM